jgi:di/tricarboxylate transporter
LAIVATVLDFLPFQLSLGIALVSVILMKIISAHEVYESISWPVIVLIGSLIPFGEALGSSGAAQALVSLFFALCKTWTKAGCH